jgi:hypothetical protein
LARDSRRDSRSVAPVEGLNSLADIDPDVEVPSDESGEYSNSNIQFVDPDVEVPSDESVE